MSIYKSTKRNDQIEYLQAYGETLRSQMQELNNQIEAAWHDTPAWLELLRQKRILAGKMANTKFKILNLENGLPLHGRVDVLINNIREHE